MADKKPQETDDGLPGVPRPQVNVRPISIGEALGLVSSKDVENAENSGQMQHLATDDEVDKAALMRPKAGAPPTTTGKGAKMVIPDNWEYKPNVPQATKDALATSDKIEHNAAVGPITGAGREALHTLSGASRIAQRGKQAAKKAIGMDVVDPRSKAQLIEGVQPGEMGIFGEHVNPEDVTPSDTSELVGGIGENVGEYMLGDALIKGIPGVGRLLSAGGKAKLPVRMLTSAAENAALAGGQDYVKSGGEPKAALEGAEYGGATGAGSELISSAAGAVKSRITGKAAKMAAEASSTEAKDLEKGTQDFITKRYGDTPETRELAKDVSETHAMQADNRAKGLVKEPTPIVTTPPRMEPMPTEQGALGLVHEVKGKKIPLGGLPFAAQQSALPMSDTDRAAEAFIRRERLGKPEGRVAEPGRPSAMNVPPEEAQAAAQGYIQDLGAGKTGAPAPIKAKAAAQGMSLPEPGSATGSGELPFPEGVSKIEHGTNAVLEGRVPKAGEPIDPILSHHTYPIGEAGQNFATFDSSGRPLGGINYSEDGGTATITSALSHGPSGSGLGRKMYTALAQDLAAKGFDSLESDTALTPEARRLWRSMMRENPGIVEKGGRFRWDLGFITPPESGPVGVSALNNQTENVLGKYGFRPPSEAAEEAGAVASGAKPGPVSEDFMKATGIGQDQMNLFAEEGKKMLQEGGKAIRHGEGRTLLAKLLTYGAADYAADKTMDALGITPAVKYVVLGAMGGFQVPAARKAFINWLEANPSALRGAAAALKAGKPPLGVVQGLARMTPTLVQGARQGNRMETDMGSGVPSGWALPGNHDLPPGWGKTKENGIPPGWRK